MVKRRMYCLYAGLASVFLSCSLSTGYVKEVQVSVSSLVAMPLRVEFGLNSIERIEDVRPSLRVMKVLTNGVSTETKDYTLSADTDVFNMPKEVTVTVTLDGTKKSAAYALYIRDYLEYPAGTAPPVTGDPGDGLTIEIGWE